MEFFTHVEIPLGKFQLEPCQPMLFVGSCFADEMGKRFSDELFRTMVNPFGVMYNPASIFHTVSRLAQAHQLPFIPSMPACAVITLGTNHVYIEKSNGEIVDNCRKRPQNLFREEQLSVDECFSYLASTVKLLIEAAPHIQVIVTVSPIRYRKYGYHGSRLSKATLLLAANQLTQAYPVQVAYFPAYEILNDELRDYRFYRPDMLHPSEQAVDFVFSAFSSAYFGDAMHRFLDRWHPIRKVLQHRPLHPESSEYLSLLQTTQQSLRQLRKDYPQMPDITEG